MDHEDVKGDFWIRKLSKERWMVQAMEGAIVGTSDGSRSSRLCKRWITNQSKEKWIRKLSKEILMVQAMEGA